MCMHKKREQILSRLELLSPTNIVVPPTHYVPEPEELYLLLRYLRECS